MYLCVLVSVANCWDGDLRPHEYTPNSPEDLNVSVVFRQDMRRQLQPVLHISWKIKIDGKDNYNTDTVSMPPFSK